MEFELRGDEGGGEFGVGGSIGVGVLDLRSDEVKFFVVFVGDDRIGGCMGVGSDLCGGFLG